MIEYILVVVVSVILILGLIQRMYQPMDTFLKGLMGTYVACLLETGELPALGNDDGATTCRPPLFVSDLPPPESPPSSSKNSKGKDDKSTDDSDKADGDSSKNASKRAGSGSGDGSNSKTLVLGARGGTGSVDGGSAGGKKIEIALEGGGSGSFFGSSAGSGSGSIYRKREKYLAVEGGIGEEMKKRQEKEDAKTQVSKADGPEAKQARKKMNIDPPAQRKIADDGSMGSGFSIGEIVKYLLIAGIIIVLLVLIGGQALQLSKSWEKGE